ncbi:MAG TPA: universal stress protein [Desulfobacterales bacterium]
MQSPVRNILCATDFSRHGIDVIRFSAGLSRALDARLQVFHAVCHGRTPGTDSTPHPSESARARRTEKIRRQVQSILGDRATPWDAIVRFGDPVDEISAVTRSEAVDLVVAASYGLPGWKRFLLGTVVESMAAVLDTPLWVMPAGRDAATLPREVLIACELTEDDHPLYRWATPLAAAFESRMHWVNVAESPVYPEMVEPDTGPYGETQQILQERLNQQLIARQPTSPRVKSQSRTAVLTGNAGEALITYARRQSVDLIVAGLHRKPSSGKHQISSTALALLRRAPCAVMTVPLGTADPDRFRRQRYGRQKRNAEP